METLIIGIACAFIGALAGHRLGLHEARCDKRRDKINAVADFITNFANLAVRQAQAA